MPFLTLFLATAITFLVLDAFMLNYVLSPMFRAQLGEVLLETPRMGAAVVFYLMYVGAIVWLVSLPALRADLPIQALVSGAVLGAAAYGTYELTNMATLRDWSWHMVLTDWTWGAVLTGVSAWVGVLIARAFGQGG